MVNLRLKVSDLVKEASVLLWEGIASHIKYLASFKDEIGIAVGILRQKLQRFCGQRLSCGKVNPSKEVPKSVDTFREVTDDGDLVGVVPN